MTHLPPFDPNANYKAATYFRYAGNAIVPGTPIDKDAGDQRSLQLLYESHKIVVATDEEIEAAGGVPGALTDDEQKLADQLVADNDRASLDALATKPPLNIVDAAKMATKADVAAAIVRARRVDTGVA